MPIDIWIKTYKNPKEFGMAKVKKGGKGSKGGRGC